jgi:peptidoglycan/xylan/chitin deacetylase (PgdA/CDA1 family)
MPWPRPQPGAFSTTPQARRFTLLGLLSLMVVVAVVVGTSTGWSAPDQSVDETALNATAVWPNSTQPPATVDTTTAPTTAPSSTAPTSAPTTAAPTTAAPTTQPPPPPPTVPLVPGTIWPGPLQVALTFDDGPDPNWTPAILDVLAQYGVPATFFVLGSSAQRHPDLVNAMVAGGHSVQNHTWDHPYLTGLPDEGVRGQLSGASDMVEEITGKRPTCWRPPYGVTDGRVDQLAVELGMNKVIWNVAPNDYLNPPPQAIIDNVMGRAAALAGGPLVVVLHDGGGARPSTLASLPGMIESLAAGGFTFVSLC